MLFNSLEFIIFFPVVTLVYFLVPHRFRWIHLLLASCIFYAAYLPSYLLILLVLIVIDYTAGIAIEKSVNKKKLWLIASIIANIGLLAIFKYYNFFISNINTLTGAEWILHYWALPIGLSFHTFQSLSYTIEVYRGKQKAVKHAGYYALYVMFYPQLVAGPIERPQHLLPQLQEKHRFSSEKLYEGLRLMAWGFFKKTVIADRVGEYADTVFQNPGAVHSENIWLALLFFSIQIYADFSGYSDIAIGAARCMGIDLTTNFNRPYASLNIRDFWRRWHISLSSWFRDYVYIPLGGNRKGPVRQKLNLLATFMLSGLWHGAGWTFIIWGFLHGIYVLIYDWWKQFTKKFNLITPLAWILTFLAVSFAWIFFRSLNLSSAVVMIKKAGQFSDLGFTHLTQLKTASIQYGNFSLAFILATTLYMFMVERSTSPKLTDLNQRKYLDLFIFTSCVLLIFFYGVFHRTSFIYFQF